MEKSSFSSENSLNFRNFKSSSNDSSLQPEVRRWFCRRFGCFLRSKRVCFIMSTVLFCSVILLNIFLSDEWKSTKKIMEDEDLEEEYEVDVFCKSKNRLIKLERNTEFYPVDTYLNSSISMQCKYCEEEDDGLPKNWNHQKHIFTGNVTEVELSMNSDLDSSKIFVTKVHSLIIRNVQEKDMGIYFCKAPFVDNLEKSFNYLVDIMNRSVEDVTGNLQNWKNYSNSYFEPLNKMFATENMSFINYLKINITLFTDWSEWSECDACSSIARKYRIGRCRVKPVCDDPKKCFDKNLSENDTFFDEKHNTESSEEFDSLVADSGTVKKDIVQFSISLSCRSWLLKTLLPQVYVHTSEIPDFILQSNCTGVCKGRATSKGARYKRSLILTEGTHLTLVCPDSTIDSEVRWEHNKRRLYMNEGSDYVAGSEEPRIYVDSFSTLYLFEVTEEESGNYTCFVDGFRMQEVKIIVLKRSVFFTKEFRRHLNYLAIVFLLCFIAYLSGITLICIQKRREERGSGPAWRSDESDKLLDNYESS